MYEQVSLNLNFNGKFRKRNGVVTYENGDVKETKTDIDYIAYWPMLSTAKYLGYGDDLKMYYLVPDSSLMEGLKPIVGDISTIDMLPYLRDLGRIDVFYAEVGIEDLVDNTEDKERDSADSDSEEEMNNLDLLTDEDDDEELQLSRHRVDKFMKNKRSVTDIPFDEDHEDENSSDEDRISEDRVGLDNRGDEDRVGMDNRGDNRGVGDSIGGDMSGFVSDYYSSSDPGSYASAADNSEDDEAARKRSRFPLFNERYCRLPQFEVGMVFSSPSQFREAITAYSVASKRELYYVKNTKKKVSLKCVGKNCPWMIYASVNQNSSSLQVKTFIDKHDCNICFKNRRVTSSFLANHFKDRIQAFPTMKLIHMKRFSKNELKVEVTLNMCKRAKQKVLTEIEGNYKEDFAKLWDYAEELRTTNVGSTIEITVTREGMGSQPRFQRIYICFEACKQGWKAGCRPIIGLDGCFLKGICKGELLAAVGRDANNQMFPIAWAVVEGKNKSSWKWFLELLCQDIGFSTGLGLTLISDKQKGLVYAVSELLPHVEHRMCARHIYANWSKEHRGLEFKRLFWKCAKSRTVPEFEDNMNQIQELSVKAYEDAMKNGPKQWSKAFFSTYPRCDIVDNNLSETFNGWILEARCKSIVKMLEDIRLAIMNRMHMKRDVARSWNGDFGQRIKKVLNANKEESFKCDIEWNGVAGYEVKHAGQGYVVNLGIGNCSCREWDLTGIPCPHVICAVNHKGDDIENYVDYWYRKETYLKTFECVLEPVKGPPWWPKTGLERLLPPPFKKIPGRPKRCRRKDPTEVKKTGKLTKSGSYITCSVCRQKGHNKKSCKKKGTSGNTNVGESSSQVVNVNPLVSNTIQSKANANTKRRDQPSDKGNGKGKAASQPNVKETRGFEPRKRTRSQGFEGVGLYVNESTGITILNPGSQYSRVVSTGRNTRMQTRGSQQQSQTSNSGVTTRGVQKKKP